MQQTLKYQIVYNNDGSGILTVGNALGNFEDILNLDGRNITDLGNLRTVDGGLLASDNPELRSTGQLYFVGNFANFERCKTLCDISSLKTIRGILTLRNTAVKSWPDDLEVGEFTILPDGGVAKTAAEAKQWFLKKFPQDNKPAASGPATGGSLAGGPA